MSKVVAVYKYVNQSFNKYPYEFVNDFLGVYTDIEKVREAIEKDLCKDDVLLRKPKMLYHMYDKNNPLSFTMSKNIMDVMLDLNDGCWIEGHFYYVDDVRGQYIEDIFLYDIKEIEVI